MSPSPRPRLVSFCSIYNTKGSTNLLRWATPQSRTGLWTRLGLLEVLCDSAWGTSHRGSRGSGQVHSSSETNYVRRLREGQSAKHLRPFLSSLFNTTTGRTSGKHAAGVAKRQH